MGIFEYNFGKSKVGIEKKIGMRDKFTRVIMLAVECKIKCRKF